MIKHFNQRKWHVDHKDVFSIIHAFKGIKHLLIGPKKSVNIYIDASLKFILGPAEIKNENYAERFKI